MASHNFVPEPQDVVDNPGKQRLELTVGDQTAFLVYERTSDRFTVMHT